MAAVMQPPPPVASRPQLQAISKGNAGLDEQLHQAAHIIGLPDNWDKLEEDARIENAQRLVRGRAEWVLRWVLDKLKDTTDHGSQARANVTAWKLVDWMIHTLPVSRCAPHLRDAQFLTIVERTLDECFGSDISLQPEPAARNSNHRDESESSETVQEEVSPMRKRKRGSSTTTPSKRVAVQGTVSAQLFDAIKSVLQSIRDKGNQQEASENLVQREHMLMVLRTESAQAARILKCWLLAVQKLIAAAPALPESTYSDLSLAVDVWDLRTIDSKDDTGASAEQFSAECLVPVLLLSQILKEDQRTDDRALAILDRLLAKHTLNPSRITFFDALGTNAGPKDTPKAEFLSSTLGPLRAKLLQAAQIEDSGESVPPYLSSLSHSIPHLLDLVVRFSPARTPKSRIADKPWVQAAFVTLVECAGCSLEVPEFSTPMHSVAALQDSLRVLASHDVSLSADVVRDLFWYHSGVKFPVKGERVVHWRLVAAVTAFDPDLFLADDNTTDTMISSNDRPGDLASFLFHQITARDMIDAASLKSGKMSAAHDGYTSEAIIQDVIIPIMSAFARNRSLRTFLNKWTFQLSSPPRMSESPVEELGPIIWEHDLLKSALASFFEVSLAPVIISNILDDYAENVEARLEGSAYQYSIAHANDVILQALLQSIKSDENIAMLKPQLQTLWNTYSSRFLSKKDPSTTSISVTWTILCQLLTHLWPIHLHGSASLQAQVLHPLVTRAASYITPTKKDETSARIDSPARAAALGFYLSACDLLLSVPSGEEPIVKKLPKVLKAISPAHLQSHDLLVITETFCAAYVSLFNVLDSEACEKAISGLFLTISGFDDQARQSIASTFSQSIFQEGSQSAQASFISACLGALSSDDNNLHSTCVSCLLQATPLSIAREQREAILDNLVPKVHLHPGRETALLSVVARMMDVPNATAEICSNGSALFDLAQRLHDAGLESPSALYSLQSIAQSTLTHVLPNKGQTQNKRFIEKYEGKVASAIKKSRKCLPFKLAILRGTFLASLRDDTLISVNQYVDLLAGCLQDGTTSSVYILQAFDQIPFQAFDDHPGRLESTQTLLRTWITSKFSLDSSWGAVEQTFLKEVPTQLWSPVLVTIAKYQLHPNPEWLLLATLAFFRKNLSARDQSDVISSIEEALLPLAADQKLQLMSTCLTSVEEGDPAATFQLMNVLISVMADKLEADTGLREQQLALLPGLCDLLGESPDDASFNILLDSITLIIREKHSLTTQHSIECVITVLLQLASRNSPRLSTEHASAIFARICATTRSILLLHRGRIGGRFHLLIPLLQNLLLCLFIPNGNRGSAHPPWLSSNPSSSGRLTPQNASQFTRLLSTLCSPTQSSVQRPHRSSQSQASASKKDLNDPVKAARKYASQFVYPLLSSYCRFQLYGRLEPQTREKLMAGIWDVVGVGSLDRASLDSMFAGLGKSERDVWKGVWREWERSTGRKDASRGD